MATQTVTEKIISDAKKEAENILKKYKEEAAKIKKASEEKLAAKRKEIEQEADARKKAEILRAVSQKRLELNKVLVFEKRKLIQEVISGALKKLTTHKKYLDFLKELIENSGEKDGELILNKKDLEKHGATLKKFLQKKGLKYKINTDDKIIGGVMVKREKTIHHGTLKLISELLKDELTIAVSEKLF